MEWAPPSSPGAACRCPRPRAWRTQAKIRRSNSGLWITDYNYNTIYYEPPLAQCHLEFKRLRSFPVCCTVTSSWLCSCCYATGHTSRVWRLPISFSPHRQVAALQRRSTAAPHVRCSLSPRVTARSRGGVPFPATWLLETLGC